MSKQIPIASVAFFRKWQLAHRKLTGKMHNIRHASMARILALTDMTPEQVAVVTAHHARGDEAMTRVTLPPREHQRGAYPQALYSEYAQKLLDGGHAYRCFCTEDERKARRKTLSAAYDRHCRASRDGVAARIAAGDKHVVRFAAPTEGETMFCDGVYGDVVVDNETLDDAVIVKADGKASHILTNVVDDHLNGVSHAVRYEHWIINVPVQIHLYAALGWQAPKFSHVKTETLADVIASDVRFYLFADALALAEGKTTAPPKIETTMNNITLRGEFGRTLSISILGYLYERPLDPMDACWLRAAINADLGAFQGRIDATLSTYDLTKLLGVLERTCADAASVESFQADEEALTLRLEQDQAGRTELTGVLRGDEGIALSFCLKGDRTFFQETLTELRRVIQAFPTKREG